MSSSVLSFLTASPRSFIFPSFVRKYSSCSASSSSALRWEISTAYVPLQFMSVCFAVLSFLAMRSKLHFHSVRVTSRKCTGGYSLCGAGMNTSSPRSEKSGSSFIPSWDSKPWKVKSRRFSLLPSTSDHSENTI